MINIQSASVVLTIICVIPILYLGVKTDLLREQSPDKTKPNAFSFGRFQLWIWTLVICPAFILCWGFSDGIPDINQTSLALLGIPVSVTVTSAMVATTNEKALRKANPGCIPELKQFRESDSFWMDVLIDDKGQLSMGRLQNLIFTLVMVVIYISMFIGADLKQFPDFELNTFVLMGISSAGFVLGKSVMK